MGTTALVKYVDVLEASETIRTRMNSDSDRIDQRAGMKNGSVLLVVKC